MATAQELDESMEGSERGYVGVSASRLFHVTVDTRGDDPTAVTALPPLGSSHPKPNFSSLFVSTYRVWRFLGPTDWIVEVVYDIPSDVPLLPSFNWTTQVRFSGQTKRLYEDVVTKATIGYFAYNKLGTDASSLSPPNGTTHESRNGLDDRVWLSQIDGAFRKEPIEVLGNTMSIIRSTILPNVTDTMLYRLSGLIGKVHGDPSRPTGAGARSDFLGFPANVVLFAGAEIREQPGQLPGQLKIGVVYEVDLEFLVNVDEPWTPISRVEYYADETNFEAPIRKINGLEETRRLNIYKLTDLNVVWSILSARKPAFTR